MLGFFWGNENTVKSTVLHTFVNTLKTANLTVYFKRVNFIMCECYLNKNIGCLVTGCLNNGKKESCDLQKETSMTLGLHSSSNYNFST